MILKINQLSLDSISGVLLITVLSSLIIFPQAFGFSKDRVLSFTMPSISLFQLKSVSSAGSQSSDEDDGSSTANGKKNGLSIPKQRRLRFLESLPQVKFQQKKLYFGDETDRDIIKTTIPNMLYYIVDQIKEHTIIQKG